MIGFTPKCIYITETIFLKTNYNQHSLEHIYHYYTKLLIHKNIFYHYKYTFTYKYKQLIKFN